MNEAQEPCPFVYADGHRCTGNVCDWKVYGKRRGDPLFFAKKVRLYCSEMNDHAGAISSWASKERMEFYPNQLGSALYSKIEADLENCEGANR